MVIWIVRYCRTLVNGQKGLWALEMAHRSVGPGARNDASFHCARHRIRSLLSQGLASPGNPQFEAPALKSC
jgi:hypothetical protein